MQELREWLQKQGGQVRGLEPAEFEGYGLGLRCTEPLQQCEPAIQVPRSAMLSLDTAHQAKIGERRRQWMWMKYRRLDAAGVKFKGSQGSSFDALSRGLHLTS